MLKNQTYKILFILFIVFANVGCDQISKKMVRESVDPQERIELVGKKFLLMNVENDGAFLSAGSNLSPALKKILLLVLPSLMLIGALIYLFLQNDLSRIAIIGWSFVIGGGIGNMYDRILYGSVTDFFYIDLGGVFHTGVFNMADVSIMVGMGFLILYYILDSRKPKTPEVEAPVE